MDGSGLTRDQTWAGLFEQNAVVRLLGHGVHLLNSAKYVDPVLDPILTVWSIGVEKLLKLSLGHHQLSSIGTWPRLSDMKNRYRHRIVQMDDELRIHLREWGARTGASYVNSLVGRVDDDPVWVELRGTLDIYGRAGRFHHLDILGGATPTEDSPQHAWEAVEEVARQAESVAPWRLRDITGLSVTEVDEYAMAIKREIVDSMLRWWFMISRSAENGFLGQDGRAFGSSVSPLMVVPPISPNERYG